MRSTGNDGNGTFTDVTEEAGIEDPGHYGFGVVFSDLDDDGWLDIYVANDSVPNLLFHNQRDGTFAEIGLLSGTAFNQRGAAQAGMGLDVADYDGDGLFDIFVTNFSNDTNTLYQNNGELLFLDVTSVTGVSERSYPYVGWGTGFVDLDNDSWQDVFVSNGHVSPVADRLMGGTSFLQRKEVYRNLGNGRFVVLAPQLTGDLLLARSTRGTAFGDHDNDGDIDVLAINLNDRPSLYRNDGGNRQHWVTFSLEGTESNRDAIGARIEIDNGGKTQVAEVRSGGSYLSHNDMRVHFGLGETTRVNSVRIRWPNGSTEEATGVDANRFVVVREGHGIVSERPLSDFLVPGGR